MELLFSYKVAWGGLNVELRATELIYESGLAYMKKRVTIPLKNVSAIRTHALAPTVAVKTTDGRELEISVGSASERDKLVVTKCRGVRTVRAAGGFAKEHPADLADAARVRGDGEGDWVKGAARGRAKESKRVTRLDRQGWFVFGGTVALVVFVGVMSVLLPQQGVMYCTENFGTCIINRSRSDSWRVLDAPCPAGQSLRYVSLGGLQIRRCHSIRVTGLSTALSVSPTACGK